MKTQDLLPDLIEIQRSSYKWFLEHGLIQELNSFSPITDYAGKLELHFMGENYKLKEPKYHLEEAKRRDSSYSVQMYVPLCPNHSVLGRRNGFRVVAVRRLP